MPTDVTTTLRKALSELEGERKRIDQQVAVIANVLAVLGEGPLRARRRAARPRKAARRSMSAAARKAVSQRMKAYWAKRKAGAAKGKEAAKK
jgi:hypothetical protein